MGRTLVLLSCLSACAAERPGVGQERGACGADRACDDGLECWSERCVRPPGADCDAVGERLATVGLGTYARREERAPAVQKLAAECRTARLTAAEGACLIEATTDDELGRCPRALLPALAGDRRGCERLGARVAAITRAELARRASLRSLLGPVIDELGPTVTRSCVEDRWSDQTKACVRDATGYDDGEACLDRLDLADRRALERRLTMLVKRGMAMPRSGSGPAEAPPPFPGLPPACTRYLAVMEALASCPALPDQARPGVRQALDAMRDGWRQQAALPAEAQAASEAACRQGSAGVIQTMRGVGCTPPP